jgi:hypothetical protein
MYWARRRISGIGDWDKGWKRLFWERTTLDLMSPLSSAFLTAWAVEASRLVVRGTMGAIECQRRLVASKFILGMGRCTVIDLM